MKVTINCKVSVITAVYNAENTISETVESVLLQSFNDFEYIIIDDCSSDNSLLLLENFAKKDSRITVISNKKNLGSAESRNIGLRLAKGKYIAILDHDDVSMPERLCVQFEYLEKHPTTVLVGSSALVIDSKGNVISTFRAETNVQKIKNNLVDKNFFYHPSVMYRNGLNIFYRPKILYADDYDLYLQMLTKNLIMANIKQPLIKYRVHSAASSQKNFTKMELFAQTARLFYLERLQKGSDDYATFDPSTIVDMDVEHSDNQSILLLELTKYSKTKKYDRVHKITLRLLKNGNFSLRVISLYIISLFISKLSKYNTRQ